MIPIENIPVDIQENIMVNQKTELTGEKWIIINVILYLFKK